jgi:hypothetical protein
MTEDVLKRATEALREEGGEPNLRSGATRARLLDSAEKRYTGGRRWLLRWCVAIASMFVVGTALARVAEYWPALREAISLAPSAPDQARQHRKPPAKRAPNAPALSPLASPEPAPSMPAPQQPTPEPARPVIHALRWRPARVREAPAPAAPTPEPSAPAGSAPEPSAPAGRSAELDLFRRALALHTARDPGALSAWDAYLRVADRGVLVPEARYNRALCLVRLGRSAEARKALEPFARGAFGDYRRAEAEALLRALSQ